MSDNYHIAPHTLTFCILLKKIPLTPFPNRDKLKIGKETCSFRFHTYSAIFLSIQHHSPDGSDLWQSINSVLSTDTLNTWHEYMFD